MKNGNQTGIHQNIKGDFTSQGLRQVSGKQCIKVTGLLYPAQIIYIGYHTLSESATNKTLKMQKLPASFFLLPSLTSLFL